MIFQNIKDFVSDLDKKQLYQLTAGLVGGVIVCAGLIIFWHNSAMGSLQNKLVQVNKTRKDAQVLIDDYKRVTKQQEDVKDLISKDASFKIRDFFNLTIKDLNLTANLGRVDVPEPPQDLGNGYNEIKLTASFTGLNMKDVCDLLENIERERRVFIKILSMTKDGQLLDVTLEIATLQLAKSS